MKPKPCPFCGCEYTKDDEDWWHGGNHADWCPLGNEGGWNGNVLVLDEPEYIEAWNRRVSDDLMERMGGDGK